MSENTKIEVNDWFFDDTIDFLLETAIENRIIPDLIAGMGFFSGYERRQTFASQDLLELTLKHIPEEDQKFRWSKAFIKLAERNNNWQPEKTEGLSEEYLDELASQRDILEQARKFVDEQEKIENDRRENETDIFDEEDDLFESVDDLEQNTEEE